MNKKILKTINYAIENIPAYRDFLIKSRVKLDKISNEKEFLKLPIINKETYIQKYPLFERIPKNTMPDFVYASSGSSGVPTFWFGSKQHESVGGDIHEQIVRDVFKIKKNEPTLVIVCFAMGVWIAGNYTVASFRELSKKGYLISVISPSIEHKDILNVLKNLAPMFKNVIICGYPPFLADVINEVKKNKISLPSKLKFLLSGDRFPETWRSDFLKACNITEKEGEISLVNVYGSADGGPMAFETPLTVFIRKTAQKNKKLSNEFFGEGSLNPGIYQYDPDYVYFENQNNELVITANTSSPLIRYNLHDIGAVFSYNEVMDILKKFNLTKLAINHGLEEFNFPFVVVKGRTDVAVTFYALNIYPENIKAGINDRRVRNSLTGNFIAQNTMLPNNKGEVLEIIVEVKNHERLSYALKSKVEEAIVDNLVKTNIEYNKIHTSLGSKSIPKIKLRKTGQIKNSKFLSHALLSLVAKKPIMLT